MKDILTYIFREGENSVFIIISFSLKVLQFQLHSSTNCPLLSPSQSLSLLEQLDSTQTQLATMLTSRHIHPLRNETSQWAGKLSSIAEVLQLWVSVQELWLSLQPVFNNTLIAKVHNILNIYTITLSKCLLNVFFLMTLYLYCL